MQDYWIKQGTEPVFNDLLWSRPVNKNSAGKLLIIGGNLHGFNKVAGAYNVAQKAGAGSIRIILPDALQKLLGKIIPEAEFAPSTSSGSFSKNALAEILVATAWADGILLAGEFGKNSETAILLESLMPKINIPTVIAGDTVDELINNPNQLAKDNIVVVASFSQLQKLAIKLKHSSAFTNSMTVIKFVETLHDLATFNLLNLICSIQGLCFVATDDQISSTKTNQDNITIASQASVWFMQNPNKKFEAITTSLVANK